jgi:hypothetical protein
MPAISLKPAHKPVRDYYTGIAQKNQLHLLHEGSVAPVFADLLAHTARQVNYTLNEQHPYTPPGTRRKLRLDGAVLTPNNLLFGVWEAKDADDDLDAEIAKKFSIGYPDNNILFQAPERAVLVQNGERVLDRDITQPENLVFVLERFFAHQNPLIEGWEQAVGDFKDRVPEVAESLLQTVRAEYGRKEAFTAAFDAFYDTARSALNPNLSRAAVEEMLIQHLMTERIFRRVFDNPDFAHRNAIAREIEKVITALTSRAFNRAGFFHELEQIGRAHV